MSQNTVILLAIAALLGLVVGTSVLNRPQPVAAFGPIPESNDETWRWRDWRGNSRAIEISRNVRYRD